MLISEIHGWEWLITWDNPMPADSSTMLAALQRLGRLDRAWTKTTVKLAPKAKVNAGHIRRAIQQNLHGSKGNAVYANLKTRRIFEYGAATGHKWRSL